MEIPSSEIFDISSVQRSLNRFDTRILCQTRDIYEALPEVTGMHFTQADQIDSIAEKGFQMRDGGYPDFVYIFDKKDTDEHYGSRLKEAEALGFAHYNARETINRFHASFTKGLNKYGLKGLRDSNIARSGSVHNFLTANKDMLPAVVFADVSKAKTIPKGKSASELSQAYFQGLESEHILNVIKIEDEDIEEIKRDAEHGISVEKSVKRILVNKTVEWLLVRVKEQHQERVQKADAEYEIEVKKNPLLEWRKPLDEELGSDAVDKIIEKVRARDDIRTGKGAIQEIDGIEYLTPSALTISGIFLDQIRSKKELVDVLASYSDEDRKLAEQLQVHSFGGDEIIKLGKCKVAETVKAEANMKFARPIESLIYFGSLDDLELALLTGAKEIHLVDPGLDGVYIQQIIERVQQYGKNVLYDKNKKILSFDLEDRSILVRIYEETMQDFNLQRGIQAEAVIMYNKGPGMETKEAEKALLPNGICIDNRNDTYSPKLEDEEGI